MKDVFMIVYAESSYRGDEIHFIIMDEKLKPEYDKLFNEIIIQDNLTNHKYERSEEFLSFVFDNKLESKYTQTYAEEDWFKDYNIKHVCCVPDFGY